MQDDITRTVLEQEVRAKRTAKNSVFLDLFQNKGYPAKVVPNASSRGHHGDGGLLDGCDDRKCSDG